MGGCLYRLNFIGFLHYKNDTSEILFRIGFKADGTDFVMPLVAILTITDPAQLLEVSLEIVIHFFLQTLSLCA